jgi:hypothetical protein
VTNTTDPESTSDPVRFARRFYAAIITVDEIFHRRNIVIDPVSGEFVAALPPSLEDADSVVLHVPDESRGSLQLMAECRELDANRDASCDRLLIYHGRAEGAKFAAMRPIDVKWALGRVQIENFLLSSPLAKDEPRLCRLLNADTNALGALVLKLSGRSTIEPKVVGVDALGLDVRTRTGVVRVEFATPLTPQDALPTIEAWMRKS